MLSAYEWYSSAIPSFTTKSSRGAVAPKNAAPQVPRGIAVHVITASNPSNYVYSGYPANLRDSDSQRRSEIYAGRSAKEYTAVPPQQRAPAPPMTRASVPQPSRPTDTTVQQQRQSIDKRIGETGHGYKFHPKTLDTFIYESSIDSRSDVSSSSSSSSDTMSVDSNTHITSQRTATLRITNPSGEDNLVLYTSHPASPHPFPITIPVLADVMRIPTSSTFLEQENNTHQTLARLTHVPHYTTVESVSDDSDDETAIHPDSPDHLSPQSASVPAPPGLVPQDRGVSSALSASPPRYESPVASQGRTSPDGVRRQKVNISPPAIDTGCGGRSVRWSENLICPSPILPCNRRRGWFNKRGDQLWTNDGHYVPPEPGCDFPKDLEEYPEYGAGWMNEEGVRIDMDHRLIPKVPKRSALKKSCAQNPRPRSEVRSATW